MRRYSSDWVEDDGDALGKKLDDLAKANSRVISVVYRPATEETDASGKPWSRRAQFIIISERDYTSSAPRD
jgi:hypothetical protein